MEIKNLAQLKRVIKEGRKFIIRKHYIRSECEGRLESRMQYRQTDFTVLKMENQVAKLHQLTMEKEVGQNTESPLIGNLKMVFANNLMCGKSNSCNKESDVLYKEQER